VIGMSYGRMLGEGAMTGEPIHILDHRLNNYDVDLSITSRTSGTIIVHTRLPGRTHMICVNSFHICLMDRPLDIVRYFIYAFIYCETLG
jgi:hypothetical protein